MISQYIETALLNKPSAHLKSDFTRHSIPEFVISDNGKQYACEAYSQFSREYQFEHIISSPLYQSSGEAERAVTTTKNIQKKEGDPYLLLLSYRVIPSQIGYSPSELPNGWKLQFQPHCNN